VRAGRLTFAALGMLLSATLSSGLAVAEEGRVVEPSAIDADRPWRVRSVHLEGAGFTRGWLLRSNLGTKTRPWWAFWRDREPFVPAYLAQDVSNIERALQSDGYYEAKVDAQVTVLEEAGPPPPIPLPTPAAPPETLPPGESPAPSPSGPSEEAPEGTTGKPGLVDVTIHVDLGEPALVCSLYFDFGDDWIAASEEAELRRRLALKLGDPFDQPTYEQTSTDIAAFFSERGHPFPKVDRSARVDVPTHCVDVVYRAAPGATAAFGDTSIEGLGELRDAIATRELAYEKGEPFDSRKARETERRLRGLRIFSIVRLDHGPIDAEGEVPMHLKVTRGPENEVRFGAGYSTEEGVRGLASWWNYNFFGGGEQVGASVRISQINRLVTASYVQPHFPGLNQRTSLVFNLGQDDESTYLNGFTRLVPQVDWRVTPDLAGAVFFRGEYDTLSDVKDPTIEALKVFESSGFTASVGASVRWTDVDDLLDPRDGVMLNFAAELAGGPVLDADFSWFRTIANLRAYHPIVGDLVGALRLTLGSISVYGGTPQIPLWERFYAGGSGIYPVRGYGRRRVGPITQPNDDPLGGRSLAIGSVEARHPLFGPILGVAFVDVGDVELSSWTIAPKNFQTGVGFGVRAASPIGPVELDIGFGLDRAPGDSLVQVSFSIGPEF